ncbi:unnamed protein product [Dicrocoelium dendriticum]|nr:unnamed protein product [Dicrocoelium dendriticum]
MSVLTPAEVDCLLTELDPYVDTEEEREALGLKAFTKYFAEIPGFGERFCTEDEKDLNVVLHSDAVKNLARQAIEHIVEFINAASDTEKLDRYLRDHDFPWNLGINSSGHNMVSFSRQYGAALLIGQKLA